MTPQLKDHEVFDRARRIRFRGTKLAFATSDTDGRKPRWYEITIFKTQGGMYIAQRVGKSRIYHGKPTTCRLVSPDEITANDLDIDEIPCPLCLPQPRDELLLHAPDTELFGEIDRPTVEQWPNAGKLIEHLYVKDRELDQFRLPKVVRRALTEASQLDEGIQEAYNTEYVA